MVHLEIEVGKGKLVLEQVVSYIDSSDCFILTYFPKGCKSGKPLKLFPTLNDAKNYIKEKEEILL